MMPRHMANRVSEVESRNLDHYRAQPGNWNVQVNQLARGQFRSRIRSVTFDGLTVYDNRWGAPSLIRGQSPDNLLMLGLAAADSPSIPWCGKAVDQRVIACASPGNTVEFNVPENAHDVVVLIRPELLRQACGESAQPAVESSNHLVFESEGPTRLADAVLQNLQHFSSNPELVESQVHAANARALLLRALEDCFVPNMGSQLKLKTKVREQAVHLALEHASARVLSTSAMEMALAAGVSQKTLELAFRAQLGITPGQYLKTARLNTAHRKLADAELSPGKITEIALECGFTHLGRFSADYRKLFAELPMRTLKRSTA